MERWRKKRNRRGNVSLMGNLYRNRPLGRRECWFVDNIMIDLGERKLVGVH
jgi:hypothetical protein